jgi:hypothetical protein
MFLGRFCMLMGAARKWMRYIFDGGDVTTAVVAKKPSSALDR